MPTAEMAPSAPSSPLAPLLAPADAKADLRARMRAIRDTRDGAAAGLAIGRRILDAGLVPEGAAVSAFWPLTGEIDLRPLMHALDEAGHPLALPVVTGRGRPLIFRRWRPGARLVPRGRFAIPEPGDDAPVVRPDVVLVPLLAFDRSGNRLGYGAGHYDATLAHLATTGPVRSVGVAFAEQEVDGLPVDAWDVALDVIVTDRETIPVHCGVMG
jgi:5-formyltetrahydrofolate cyclo-ligase